MDDSLRDDSLRFISDIRNSISMSARSLLSASTSATKLQQMAAEMEQIKVEKAASDATAKLAKETLEVSMTGTTKAIDSLGKISTDASTSTRDQHKTILELKQSEENMEAINGQLTDQLVALDAKYQQLKKDRRLEAMGIRGLKERAEKLELVQKQIETDPSKVAYRWSDYEALKVQLEESLRYGNSIRGEVHENVEREPVPVVPVEGAPVIPTINPAINPVTTLLAQSIKLSYSPLEGLANNVIWKFAFTREIPPSLAALDPTSQIILLYHARLHAITSRSLPLEHHSALMDSLRQVLPGEMKAAGVYGRMDRVTVNSGEYTAALVKQLDLTSMTLALASKVYEHFNHHSYTNAGQAAATTTMATTTTTTEGKPANGRNQIMGGEIEMEEMKETEETEEELEEDDKMVG